MIGLHLSTSLTCQVCEHNLDDEDNALAEGLLFGLADPYAMCPVCFREIIEPQRSNEEYRRRVRVVLFNRYGRILKSSIQSV